MDEISLAEKLLKIISERRDRISDMLTGGSVKDFEEYKKLYVEGEEEDDEAELDEEEYAKEAQE